MDSWKVGSKHRSFVTGNPARQWDKGEQKCGSCKNSDNAGLVTQEREEEANVTKCDILPPPESSEQNQVVPWNGCRSAGPPVIVGVPTPVARGTVPALYRSTRPHHPPEYYGWNLRREECSNWLTMEHAMGACAMRRQSPVYEM